MMSLLGQRFFATILLAVVLALDIHAQDEGDTIAYSLRLDEVTVLADGMTFEEYLLKQVLANAKPLKERIATLRYSVTCQLEKDIDLTKFPHRRTITFAARLAGYGPIVDALREHKHFGITMAEDVYFKKGKITTSNVRMVEMKQPLTEKQKASFLKHDGMMSDNVYDRFYKKVRQKVKELQKKRRKKQDTGLEYSGSYTSGNRTFYVVKLDNMKVHIADDCWQISRLSYQEDQNSMYYEFKEIRPGLFLLSHGTAKFYLDKAKWPKGYIAMKMQYAYR
ncbi:MAG: hypothetical protein IJ902_06235 [Prevotella sp.]|nr:hypothetical protein [Prevotella sp.]